MSPVEIVSGVLVALGTVLICIAGLGMLRLPDIYSRLNAVTKAAALGVCCVLFGALLLKPTPGVVVTLLAAIVLQLLTVPVGGFAISRAAFRAGTPLSPITRFDESGSLRTGAGGDERATDAPDD
jgi:multicomponent Na+:H+ antiporter subunit G